MRFLGRGNLMLDNEPIPVPRRSYSQHIDDKPLSSRSSRVLRTSQMMAFLPYVFVPCLVVRHNIRSNLPNRDWLLRDGYDTACKVLPTWK
jgi:hypothetical protein